MTIYDIARMAGVSASTVSRVMNNREGISSRTRERVMEVIRNENFCASDTARSLSTQYSSTIGILVADIRNQHHIEGAYMIAQRFLPLGYCSLLLNTGYEKESMVECIRTLSTRRISGLVLIGSIFQNSEVEEALKSFVCDIPVVFQNGELDLPNLSSAVSRDDEGTADAVRFLYGKGRRTIAFVNNNDTSSNRKKMAGYRKAVSQLGLKSIIIPECEDSAEGGEKAAEKLIEAEPGVDGIIFSVDLIAAGGMRKLLSLGRRIPEDIAILGTDNSSCCTLTTPMLSSIDTRLPELSAACFDILKAEIGQKQGRKNVSFECRIVERQTT